MSAASSPQRVRVGTSKRGSTPDTGDDSSDVKNAQAAYSQALASCRTGLEQLVQSTILGTIEALNLDPTGRKVSDLQPVFDKLLRVSQELAEQLSHSDQGASRSALKQQATVNKVKLESSRTAASVSMSNAKAELQANFAMQLESKVAAMKAGGSTELKEAHEKIAELQEALDAATNTASRSEEMLKTLRSLLREKEAAETKLQQELDEMSLSVKDVKAYSEKSEMAARREITSMRAKLQEAGAEAERAALRNPQECKSLVAKLAVRLRGELQAISEGSLEDSQSQLTRLLAEMETLSKKLAEAEARGGATVVVGEGGEQLEATLRELANVKQQLAALQSGSPSPLTGDSGDAALREENKKLAIRLEKANRVVEEKTAEVAKSEDAVDALQRDMTETLTRAIAEAQRAAAQEAEVCKRQVSDMAVRLKAELDAVRRHERETAHAQLNRLLDELQLMNQHVTKLESKVTEADKIVAKAQEREAKLQVYENSDRKIRESLARALSELHVKVQQNTSLSDQVSQLVAKYLRLQHDANSVRFTLDRALREVQVTVNENTNLSDRLKQLLDAHKNAQAEADSFKIALDNERSESEIIRSENTTLREKASQLLEQYRAAYDKEQHLRMAIKQQHISLHAAFHRVKDVEGELSRAHGAAVEERDTLVTTALHALNQLRLHLGAIHNLRPEVTKPVDDVLVVKRALKVSASVGQLPSPGRVAGKPIEAFVSAVAQSASPAKLGTLLPVSLSASPSQIPELPAAVRHARAISPIPFSSLGGPVLPMKRGLLRVPHPPGPGVKASGFSDLGFPTDPS